MNTTELLKYISPIAIIGIIWSVVQFYQKRATEKRELRRKEKIDIFYNLHITLNNLKTVFLNFQYFLNSSYRTLNKKVGNFDLILKNHSDNFENIDKQIENLNDNSLERIIHLRLQQKAEFKLFKSKLNDSKEIIDKELNLMKKELLKIPSLIKNSNNDLNNISLLGLVTDNSIKLKILKLSGQINQLSLDIESNDAITEYGNLTEKFIQQVITILKEIYLIESMMQKELN